VKDKKNVNFLTGHGERSRGQGYGLFVSALEKQYAVSDLTLDENTPATAVASGTDVIIVAGPQEPLGTSTRNYLDKFMRDGGSVFRARKRVETNPGSLTAQVNQSDLIEWVSGHSITIERNLVYDLRSNETVQMGGGGMVYLVRTRSGHVRVPYREVRSRQRSSP